MMFPSSDEFPFDVRLIVRASESATPTLLDVSGFLYDFNLGYELSRLATDERYDNFRFSNFALFRNGRPLRDEDRLRVSKLSHQSPIELQTVVIGVPAAVGAFWGIVQIVEKISNWRLNREKLEQDIIKLRRENRAAGFDRGDKGVRYDSEDELRRRMIEREAQPLLDGVARRLSKSAVRVNDLEIRFDMRIDL
jgi:hypothetical protein